MMLTKALCAVLGLVLAGNLKCVRSEKVDSCQVEDFKAQCQRDEIIIVRSAEYGRMREGRCMTSDFHIGCTNDVLPALDKFCSGRAECSLEVIELETDNENCMKDLTKYLEVEFSCIKVETSCRPGSNVLTSARSHLSNQISCGSPRPHWSVRAQTGQTINISLTDFGASDKPQTYITCKYVYGYILERTLGINHTICGGRDREVALYSSKTNNIEIYLVPKSRTDQKFIVNYEVTGCPDLKKIPHSWYKREKNEAVIGCETNDQEWRLTCSGNTWHGTVGNCTVQEYKTVVAASKTLPDAPSQMYSNVLIITAFAGGAIVIVAIIIVIGVVYLQKYRMKQETSQLQKTYATMTRGGQTGHRPGTNGPLPPPNGQTHTGTLRATNPWADPLTGPDNMTSYPTQWACTTRDTGNETLVNVSDEKESLYNSLK